MAGFFDRLKTIFGAKADSALDRLEDPRQTLDYSYQKQLELLQQVRKGVAEVATSRKRVELQLDQLNAQIAKYDDAARQALTMNREDLAREALTRKSGLQQQLADKKITIELSPAARGWLAREGYEPAFGARPLRRLIMKEIGDVLTEEILFGALSKGGRVRIGRKNNTTTFTYQ